MDYNEIIADYFMFDPINNMSDIIFLNGLKKYEDFLNSSDINIGSDNLEEDMYKYAGTTAVSGCIAYVDDIRPRGDIMEHKVGEIIQELRKDRHLRQKDLANAIGITRGALSNYELGNREPSIDILWRLADYFDISIDELVGRRKFELYTLHKNNF